MIVRQVYAVDVDGTLTDGTAWTEEDVINAQPRQDVIDKVNELSDAGNFIYLFTARRDHLILPTLQWARRHGIRFHAFSNNKSPADVYVDDRMISPEAFANEG